MSIFNFYINERVQNRDMWTQQHDTQTLVHTQLVNDLTAHHDILVAKQVKQTLVVD